MLGGVPVLDIADQCAVAASPVAVALDPCGPCHLQLWVPGLALTPVLDRGREGRLWRARATTRSVQWRGTAEVWLQSWHDSTIVHLYVRLDPVGATAVDPRSVRRWRDGLVDHWKDRFARWRDSSEAGREPGTAALKATGLAAEG